MRPEPDFLPGHRLKRVDQKVQHRLLEFLCIQRDQGEICTGAAQGHGDVLLLGLRTNQLDDLFEKLGDPGRTNDELSEAGEVAEALQHAVQAHDFSLDHAQQVVHGFLGLGFPEPLFQQLDVDRQRSQRILDLVVQP